jgi:hypothetical protein
LDSVLAIEEERFLGRWRSCVIRCVEAKNQASANSPELHRIAGTALLSQGNLVKPKTFCAARSRSLEAKRQYVGAARDDQSGAIVREAR